MTKWALLECSSENLVLHFGFYFFFRWKFPIRCISNAKSSLFSMLAAKLPHLNYQPPGRDKMGTFGVLFWEPLRRPSTKTLYEDPLGEPSETLVIALLGNLLPHPRRTLRRTFWEPFGETLEHSLESPFCRSFKGHRSSLWEPSEG